MTPTMSVANVTDPVRRTVPPAGGSLWMRWLSTTRPAATLLAGVLLTVYVPGSIASTTTADVRVTALRSSNVTALDPSSRAFTATEAGGDDSVITFPADPEIRAPATATVENARAAMMPRS